MAYLDDEQSTANSEPVELYKFVGTYSSYYYTSGPTAVDYDDGMGLVTYVPIAIERSEAKAGTQEDDNIELTVTMPVLEQLVIDYGFTTSPPKLNLTIYRVQPTGTGIYWIGPVTNITVDDQAVASLQCPSALGAALVGNVPNVYYQTPCNNILYDARCKVDYASNSNATTVTAIDATDARNITVGSIGALDGKLIGGELALGSGEVRMIVSQTGDVLRVNFPFNTINVGGACIVAAGCDHLYRGDCKNKFANQVNFNGFMFIPPDNPFVNGIDPAAEGVSDDACSFVHTTSPPPPESGFWAEFKLDFAYGGNLPNFAPAMNLYYQKPDLSWDTLWNVGSSSNADATMVELYPGETTGGYLLRIFQATRWPTNPFLLSPQPFHFQLQWGYGNIPGNDADHCYAMVSARVPNGAFAQMACVSGCRLDGFEIGASFPEEWYFNW